jgi:hypothetical protein
MDTMFADARVEETVNASASARDPLPIVLKAALTHVERGERDLNAAESHFTSAGLRFKELKDRVKAGEVGLVSWADYCARHIPSLNQRTVEGYIAIATGGKQAFNFKQGAEMRAFASGGDAFQEDVTGAAAFRAARQRSEERAAREAHMRRDERQTSSRSSFDDELRRADERAQAAARQARRRAKSSSIREANGGKPSQPRDKERRAQLLKLIERVQSMDAAQLRVINELIEERWP